MDKSPLETQINQQGKALFARMREKGPWPFGFKWFENHLLNFTTANEALKIQSFRFIDALPALKTPAQVAEHLHAYFGRHDTNLPSWIPFFSRFLPSKGLLANMVSAVVFGMAGRMASKFIAGANFQEVEQKILGLRKNGLAFTIDILGESTITEEEGIQSAKDYLDLATNLAQKANQWQPHPILDSEDRGAIPIMNVSVKLSALDPQMDPLCPDQTYQKLKPKLLPLLVFAKEHNVFIYFDMEQRSTKDLILFIFKKILLEPALQDWPHAGIAIQAYLKETFKDLQELNHWAKNRGTPVSVRLVKGAYWDYETIQANLNGWESPVWSEKWMTDQAYEECTSFLIQNRNHLKPAFASHNIRSVSNAIIRADASNLPRNAYEFQVLYGMGEPIGKALQEEGFRVRVYTPYGEMIPGMAYLVRRLLENTANDSFLKATSIDHLAEDSLLMKPAPKPKGIEPSQPLPQKGPPTVFFENEPCLDFSLESNHQSMTGQLKSVLDHTTVTVLPILNGKPIEPPSFFETRNPSHKNRIIARVGASTLNISDKAVDTALAGFITWKKETPAHRAKLLSRAADLIRNKRVELAAWQVAECGKSWVEADADVAEAIDFCVYYSKCAELLFKPELVELAGEVNSNQFIPRGVVVVIAPWNFPLAILVGMSGAALAAGNSVIIKPAEQSSIMGEMWAQILLEAGFPPNTVSFLPGIGEEIGPMLVADPRVSMIAFTGSRKVGLEILQKAFITPPGQRHIKNVFAEMGGKNAILVDDDADLDEAILGVVHSAMDFQGQKCSACSRVLVPKNSVDTFSARLAKAMAARKIGPAENPENKLGPVIDEISQKRIEKTIAEASKYADLVYQANIGDLSQEGYFVGPALFANAAPTTSLCQEEIFGPVLAVIGYDSFEHGISLANDVPYALTAGLYSRNPNHVEDFQNRIEAGNAYINRKITGAMVHRHPFGGFKLSGTGIKAGKKDYLLQFVLPRTITENTMRRGFAPGIITRSFPLDIDPT